MMEQNKKKIKKIKEKVKTLSKEDYYISKDLGTIQIQFYKYPFEYFVFSLSEKYPHQLDYFRRKMFEDGLDTTKDITEKTFLKNLKIKMERKKK